MSGRHAGRPDYWPDPTWFSVVVTLLMFAAVGAYLLMRVRW